MAPVTNTEETPAEDSLARNRTKRTRVDKTGRLAALERLKKAKVSGEKIDYKVKEEAAVYEEVDEAEYSRIVRERQEDDWIVDDDGSGYVEDGREVFDEEGDDVAPADKRRKVSQKKQKNPNIRAPNSKAKNIKSMFAEAAGKSVKKPVKDVKLNEDDLLGDLISELHSGPSQSLPPPIKLKKKTPKSNPFAVTSTPPRAPSNKPATPRTITMNPSMAARKLAPTAPRIPPPNIKQEPENVTMEIEEFVSQEESQEVMTPSPQIQEDASQDVDVSGIDFDEDEFDEPDEPKVPGSNPTADTPDIKPLAELPDFTSMSYWETNKCNEAEVVTNVTLDATKLPLVAGDNGEQVLRMFWLDAYEDPYKQPGVVYLFGKVYIESASTHVSCCIAVKNVERRIYLLPRPNRLDEATKKETDVPVTFIDLYQEFNDKVAEKYNITKFKSMKLTKYYAFEKEDIPEESDYLEVRYSAEFPVLPSDLSGSTFSHIFGTNTSILENFLMDRKLRGPGWIDIRLPQIPNPATSWCKVEAFVTRPDHITQSTSSQAPPPLVVMAMNLRTVPNPKTHQNERRESCLCLLSKESLERELCLFSPHFSDCVIQVVAAACLVHHKFPVDKPPPKPAFQQHFCVVSKPNDVVYPYDFSDKVSKKGKSMHVEITGSERALLACLLAKIQKIDPDIIVGHDIHGFDLDVLLQRISHNKIPHWSRISRLKRATMPKLNTPGGRGGVSSTATSGRLVCDTKISAREVIRCRSYDLTELTNQVLREKRQEVDQDDIRVFYNSSDHLLSLLDLTLKDAVFCLRLMYELNVLPLALQITNICGNILGRTLLGGRSERNEFLLLHAFTERGYVVPDKTYSKKTPPPQAVDDDDENTGAESGGKKGSRKKASYAGGLVLEPKKGFYDQYILLLDFNSLYPSIIQEYNICFTTVARGDATEEDEDVHVSLPDPDLEAGVLPTEIRKLVQSRRQVKALMKNPDLSPELYMQYDIRQKALKLTANSMYGCLGFTHSRFYAKPLAALITGMGREILMKTKDLVQGMNLDVIYGDTDSIMVNTNSTDIDMVYKLGNKIKAEVNKLYRLLEIDIDGVFKSMLLLKKKKYAALSVQKIGDKYVTNEEMKGLDVVRRDWCSLAKEAGTFVVKRILSGESREAIVDSIHSKLREVGEKVKEGDIATEMYHITKALTKPPTDYPDKKSLPHVQVALRLNSRGGRTLRAGDTVDYVICQDGSNLAASQRAYHPDELAKRDDLQIDTCYYLSQQVHPVVSRLCDPIDGTDSAQIAACLGLDPSQYHRAVSNRGNEEEDALLGGVQVSDEERYQDCERLHFSCPACHKDVIFDSVLRGSGGDMTCSLEKCTNPECTARPVDHLSALKNTLTSAITRHIRKYYQGWLRCDDVACGATTRRLPATFSRGHPVCSVCNKGFLTAQMSDAALYDQLCFYRWLFDQERAQHNIKEEHEQNCAENRLQKHKEQYNSLRSHVEKWLKKSAYSQVDLPKLFQSLAFFK